MIGETLSHFKILEKLGRGGMGIVYRGVDLDLDRPVAIKILPPESQQNEESVARFLREAKTASKLQHPAITTIYEFGVKDDLRYLVMEYIEGKTLKDMLKSGPLPLRQVVEITMQMADALSLASEKTIIHRDIKSENIMLTERGQVKILDFGLAKILDVRVASDHFQTTTGLVMGTITHMSPEQALGAEVDARTDIYSTGVVMFEMATGTLPFTGPSASVVMAKILNQPPPSATELNPQVPPSLERVIRKCLEKNRDDRYPTATNLLAELRSLKREIEKAQEIGGTVVLPTSRPPSRAPRAKENLEELIPRKTSPATPAPASGGVAQASGGATWASGAALLASGGFARASGGITPASGRVASGSGRRGPASGAVAPVVLEEAVLPQPTVPKESSRKKRAATGFTLFLARSLRKLIGLTFGLYSLACVALFVIYLLPPAQFQTFTRFLPRLHWIVDPLVGMLNNLIGLELVYKGSDFMPLLIAVGVYFLQLALTTGLDHAVTGIRKSTEERPIDPGISLPVAQERLSTAAASSRMSLLREYAVAKRMLNEAQREMTFLSVDVVGSTKMKIGEEKITIEHAFAEYKKFLERIFRECRSYKVAWTPDGVMVCFPSVDDGVLAGQKIIQELEWFNSDIHQLRGKFHVRAGVNVGAVLIPEEKPLEDISDHVIDVAGHLQKEGTVDTLWVSDDVYARLATQDGFEFLEREVDGHQVYAWRKPE